MRKRGRKERERERGGGGREREKREKGRTLTCLDFCGSCFRSLWYAPKHAPTPFHTKERVVFLFQQGLSLVKIANRLLLKYDNVRNIVRNFRKNGKIERQRQ